MFASTFAIDGDTLKRLSDDGVEAFGGVFDRDAIRAARERDIMILTVPAHEAVTLSKETYSGFGNYFVRELTFEMKKYDLDTDGRLALYCSRVNRANNFSIFKDGESILLKSGLSYEELQSYDFGSHDLRDSVMASDNDLTDDLIVRILASGVRQIILPGTKRTYSNRNILVLGIDFTRLNN
jgi:phosphoribosylaminoimidazolecarboxamide formyltransferase/IMP cyclohydrolase